MLRSTLPRNKRNSLKDTKSERSGERLLNRRVNQFKSAHIDGNPFSHDILIGDNN